MGGRYLLDTNVVIELLRGNEGVKTKLASEPEAFVSVVVLGQLYFGARKSRNVERNVERIEEFVTTISVLGCEHETSRRYGALKQELGRQGRLIPENDKLIAATALQHHLTVVTRDTHFEAVEELDREEW
jgi:tRNA(fMet)-specific endonuclease VapC